MDLDVENGGVEVDRVLGWGKSLPIPSVQEMVRNDPKFISERYIQENDNRPLNLCFFSEFSEVPVIDLSLLIKGNEDELNKLDFACKECGFFQVQLKKILYHNS